MEYQPPFPPTPHHRRWDAIRAFVDGEAAMDAGEIANGVGFMKRANYLAWELDAAEWPAWAHAIYQQLCNGAPPPAPPPILAAASSCAVTQRFVSADILAARHSSGNSQQWWASPAAIVAIAAAMRSQHFVVLDEFCGGAVASTLRAACVARWEARQDGGCSFFHPAKVAEPGGSTGGSRSALTRSDHIAWADPADSAAPAGLREAVGAVDALVRLLQPQLLQGAPAAADAEETDGEEEEEAAAVVCRQRPQVARYGEGDAFARHCDNVSVAPPGANSAHAVTVR